MKEALISDIDGVLAELYPNLNNFYNKNHGANFKITDYVYYDLEKVWGVDKKRAMEIVVDFYFSSDFKEIKPIEFSKEAINGLSEKYEIYIATSRPNFMRERTEEWIQKHYPSVNKVFFTGTYNKESTKMSKLNICLKERARLIVDDHPLIIQECAENGLVSFLFGRGNGFDSRRKMEKKKGVISVNNWKEILNYLNIDYAET